MTVEQVQDRARAAYPRTIAYCERWIAHYDNRLSYERAMLGEAGASDLLKPKPRPKQPPLLNYRQESIETLNRWNHDNDHLDQREMTKAEYSKIHTDHKGTAMSADKSHRIRVACGVWGEHRYARFCVFLTDSKAHEKPEPAESPTPPAVVTSDPLPEVRQTCLPSKPTAQQELFGAMKESLEAGVQTVSAPQLFPTPSELAERVVALADIGPEDDLLEPSAGTGALIDKAFHLNLQGKTVLVEINAELANRLADEYPTFTVHQADFLSLNGELGKFDRIVMNPPFERGADIKHIEHARGLLNPGGRLVAICANGPRQREALKPTASQWHDLEPGAFKTSGTNVNAALLVIDA